MSVHVICFACDDDCDCGEDQKQEVVEEVQKTVDVPIPMPDLQIVEI